MREFPDAKGYLIFPDDTLLFPHKLPTLDPNHIWYWPHKKLRRMDITTGKECANGHCNRDNHFTWNFYNKTTFDEFWTELVKTKVRDSNIQRYYDNLVKYVGGERRMLSAWADVFYVPSRMSQDYITLSELAARKHVELGAAVATILVGISDDGPYRYHDPLFPS